ncbi:Kinase, CDC7 [Aduncisulcus paluster]|uniref:non-specific serine/threonine protein kinase n=1 Tax=Aduncisulcus paluster TaxID=2918883 RepID=A0ABQ5KVW9_9EUKA|nr:Kinase, CDC7 [Aduncisulcus paluster]|eukprot:gnl/Carplike_NY0171/734_a1015_1849.p1 GENE.gnl/Carplike_NY0171/734_a1015_1849~~gnl/Carplike_NY0171/734_a1015_1849.p1  ORF type:complete len:407 (-),score=74.94 gnl/Carplike_NY0171/734_a1015_1849:34-1254(-)
MRREKEEEWEKPVFPEIDPMEYHISQQIGKGAFSRVYLAYTPDGGQVAIKRLKLTSKPSSILREINLLNKFIGKKNIVQLRDLIVDTATLQTTVITSYADSDDFKSCLRLYTPRDIWKYMESLITSLAECEKQGIIHRDVKPGNFLFSRKTGKGLLIDFGLAQTLTEARDFQKTRMRTDTPGPSHAIGSMETRRQRPNMARSRPPDLPAECPGVPDIESRISLRAPLLPAQPRSGTHGYRAPEILIPTRIQTTKIDVWCAGVILLCLLVGRGSIFRGRDTGDAYEIMAIRAFFGTDAFLHGVASLGADIFIAGTDVPNPSDMSMGKSVTALKRACDRINPGLKGIMPDCAYDLCILALTFNPDDRPAATRLLDHEFLQMDPILLPDSRLDGELEIDISTQIITQGE